MFAIYILIGISISLCVALDDSRSAHIVLSEFQTNNGSGIYHFNYETSDGQIRHEGSELVYPNTEDEFVKIHGGFSFTGADGIVYTVNYTADDQGFHPSGDHIVVPPFVPWIHHRQHDTTKNNVHPQYEDDGQYHEDDHPHDNEGNINPSDFDNAKPGYKYGEKILNAYKNTPTTAYSTTPQYFPFTYSTKAPSLPFAPQRSSFPPVGIPNFSSSNLPGLNKPFTPPLSIPPIRSGPTLGSSPVFPYSSPSVTGILPSQLTKPSKTPVFFQPSSLTPSSPFSSGPSTLRPEFPKSFFSPKASSPLTLPSVSYKPLKYPHDSLSLKPISKTQAYPQSPILISSPPVSTISTSNLKLRPIPFSEYPKLSPTLSSFLPKTSTEQLPQHPLGSPVGLPGSLPLFLPGRTPVAISTESPNGSHFLFPGTSTVLRPVLPNRVPFSNNGSPLTPTTSPSPLITNSLPSLSKFSAPKFPSKSFYSVSPIKEFASTQSLPQLPKLHLPGSSFSVTPKLSNTLPLIPAGSRCGNCDSHFPQSVPETSTPPNHISSSYKANRFPLLSFSSNTPRPLPTKLESSGPLLNFLPPITSPTVPASTPFTPFSSPPLSSVSLSGSPPARPILPFPLGPNTLLPLPGFSLPQAPLEKNNYLTKSSLPPTSLALVTSGLPSKTSGPLSGFTPDLKNSSPLNSPNNLPKSSPFTPSLPSGPVDSLPFSGPQNSVFLTNGPNTFRPQPTRPTITLPNYPPLLTSSAPEFPNYLPSVPTSSPVKDISKSPRISSVLTARISPANSLDSTTEYPKSSSPYSVEPLPRTQPQQTLAPTVKIGSPLISKLGPLAGYAPDFSATSKPPLNDYPHGSTKEFIPYTKVPAIYPSIVTSPPLEKSTPYSSRPVFPSLSPDLPNFRANKNSDFKNGFITTLRPIPEQTSDYQSSPPSTGYPKTNRPKPDFLLEDQEQNDKQFKDDPSAPTKLTINLDDLDSSAR